MTMKELARLAGVSPASVSRYLNGGSLSQEKKAIIRRVIEKTGYQPDMAAQMLRTRTTDLGGLIVPKLDSESGCGSYGSALRGGLFLPVRRLCQRYGEGAFLSASLSESGSGGRYPDGDGPDAGIGDFSANRDDPDCGGRTAI